MALDTQWHKTDEDLEAAVRKDTGVVVSGYSIIYLVQQDIILIYPKLPDVAYDADTAVEYF